MNKEDLDMLYWHAVNKMRMGSFQTASQYFRYCVEESPSFYSMLALAYCYFREGQFIEAKEAIQRAHGLIESERQQRFYDRLAKRLESA